MKKLIFSILVLQFFTTASAQRKTEINVSVNSGLFSFTGLSAEKETSINAGGTASAYTNNPYGSKKALGYGFSVGVKRIIATHLIVSIAAGYETLRSKISITSVNSYSGTNPSVSYAATGQTFLRHNFINVVPQIGYRLYSGTTYFDFMATLDVAYCLSASENAEAIANGTKYTTSRNRSSIKTDIRPGLQIAANYKKTGLFVGYSRGVVNYMSGLVGGRFACYSTLVRLGVTYRLN